MQNLWFDPVKNDRFAANIAEIPVVSGQVSDISGLYYLCRLV